jgi:hypothetical protein
MIACRQLGMPKNVIRTQTQFLAFMKYAVKMIYGISEDNDAGTVFEPLFGSGQGSGASPAVQLTLVVILLDAYKNLRLMDARSQIHGTAILRSCGKYLHLWTIRPSVLLTMLVTLSPKDRDTRRSRSNLGAAAQHVGRCTHFVKMLLVDTVLLGVEEWPA